MHADILTNVSLHDKDRLEKSLDNKNVCSLKLVGEKTTKTKQKTPSDSPYSTFSEHYIKVAVLKVNYCTKLSRLHCIKVNFHFLITFVLDRSMGCCPIRTPMGRSGKQGGVVWRPHSRILIIASGWPSLHPGTYLHPGNSQVPGPKTGSK